MKGFLGVRWGCFGGEEVGGDFWLLWARGWGWVVRLVGEGVWCLRRKCFYFLGGDERGCAGRGQCLFYAW